MLTSKIKFMAEFISWGFGLVYKSTRCYTHAEEFNISQADHKHTSDSSQAFWPIQYKSSKL